MERSDLVNDQWYWIWSRKLGRKVRAKKVSALDRADDYPTFEIPGEGLVGIALHWVYGEADAPDS